MNTISHVSPKSQFVQDVNKEAGAEDMFKKIGEAYEVGHDKLIP